ncbi:MULTISPECIES: hypothetical protein [Streptomyces]|uniref:hypothetical protein n=1 Tax=Streptomyces TaxID=1883 RepID=UPI00224969A0|nr:hypothetical protein [Streptomyces sp. JHD 1]MCX2969098.1 hypothetical protein [Streptomyces sp. JHD 1]
MIPFDGVYYAIEDMCTARAGAKVLRFRDREPYIVDAPVLAYRRLDFASMPGVVRYRRGG